MSELPNYDLHLLGWHNFQQLCLTITREIFGQTVEVFLDSNDGGQDGAFRGTWRQHGSEDMSGTFVVQCKFTSKQNALLTAASLREEVQKVKRLVSKGVCDNYLLLTNAGISGERLEELRGLFQAAGVRNFRAYGSTWISAQIRESCRLRMLVPRVYGLGDLSKVFDDRIYTQTRVLIDSLRDDLSKVVLTASYDQAARALDEHGFVLLLGEPASGKTTVASLLTMAAIDQWKCPTMKLERADQVKSHWDPEEPSQMFWIDDAFGALQYEAGLAYAWNHVFPEIKALLKRGGRIVMTSRDYIYNRARSDLKEQAFPMLKESQVVIELSTLTAAEKREMVYNHIKHGRQSRAFKTAIKPYLDSEVAAHPRFVPETAPRLGDPFFTNTLKIAPEPIRAFVEKQGDLLADILKGLDVNSRAALALVFMKAGSLSSPIELTAEDLESLSRFGSSPNQCTSALTALNGSMVRLGRSTDDDTVWMFKHPTIGDAVSDMLATPELLKLFLLGTPTEELLRKISCGDVGLEHAVIIPRSLFSTVIGKLREYLREPYLRVNGWSTRERQVDIFLSGRCGKEFLRMYLIEHPELLTRIAEPGLMLDTVSEVNVAVRLFECGLLPEEIRRAFVQSISAYAVQGDDGFALSDQKLRGLFKPQEWSSLCSRVRTELIPNLDSVEDDWRSNSYSHPEHMNGFLDLLDAVQAFNPGNIALGKTIGKMQEEVKAWISEKEGERGERNQTKLRPVANAHPTFPVRESRSIFEDVDE